jgi:dihydrofolate synthase/folylpolyglutamate synthase
MNDIIDEYSKLNNSVINLGLERISKLLRLLNYPEGKMKVVHIAGSNGKGSVAEYVTQILISAGKKVGTYSSPEVYDFCDQFKIDGKCVERGELHSYLDRVSALGKELSATPFEIQTAVAYTLFVEKGCEYAVIECGMGGTYDATNAINKKNLALISSISLEHTAYLGDTITKICANKAGIIRDCPAVVSSYQADEAIEFFKTKNVVFTDTPKVIKSDLYGQTFLYKGEKFSIKMLGEAQPYNASVAIEGAKILGIPLSCIKQGLENAKAVGRLEVIKRQNNLYILDGCHNPSSFDPLTNLLKQNLSVADNLVYGCLADKDIDGCLKKLSGLVKKVWVVECPSPRAMESNKIIEVCNKYFPCVEKAESVSYALERAEGKVVVCGSFTLLKEAKEWIERE